MSTNMDTKHSALPILKSWKCAQNGQPLMHCQKHRTKTKSINLMADSCKCLTGSQRQHKKK